ncbi:MAG: type I-G CRISPR-associated protein Csb2 [Acidobacteriota bacterium]
MIAIALKFPSGRFHSTPWGRHVNESNPEWPPSPWRLLRAFVATWKSKLDGEAGPDTDTVKSLLEALASPPQFALPPATTGHSRHYMPWMKGEKTLVFDGFVALDRNAELMICWPEVTLTQQQYQVLDALVTNLAFLGRAESWCLARLLPGSEANACGSRINCPPLNGRGNSRAGEPVRVLCADPNTAFANDHTPKGKQTTGNGKTRKFLMTPLYDPDWHLCMETLELHDKKWSDPPGSRWVTYARPADCLKIEPRMISTRPTPQVTVARYAIDGPVLPLVQETLPLAEKMRAALMGTYRRIMQHEIYGRNIPENAQRSVSPVFSGKDEVRRPLLGHGHAFYLPTDEDADGRLDHITVVAETGFGPHEIKALDRLRRLRFGDGEALNLLLVGLGRVSDFRALPLRESAVWISATPFLVTRHAKKNGVKRDRPEALGPQNERAFVELVLREELSRLRERRPEIPEPVSIEPLIDTQGTFRIPIRDSARTIRPIQFKRFRQKRGDDGGRRPAGALRITFSRAVRGPICLGHSSHFGLGLFVPEG